MRALILSLVLAAAPAFGQTGSPALQRCLDGVRLPDGRAAARAACDAALQDGRLPAGQRAEALAARANIRLSRRDDRGALSNITAAIRLAPNEPECRFERVRILDILEEMENLPGDIAGLTETCGCSPMPRPTCSPTARRCARTSANSPARWRTTPRRGRPGGRRGIRRTTRC